MDKKRKKKTVKIVVGRNLLKNKEYIYLKNPYRRKKK